MRQLFQKVLLIYLALSFFAYAQDDNKVAMIQVVPERIVLRPGETYEFKAIGKNKNNQIVSSFKAEWRCTGGKITQTGVYTAGENHGMYDVTASDPRTGAEGSASVSIQSPTSSNPTEESTRIRRLEVVPAQKELNSGEIFKFEVLAFNAQDKQVDPPSRLTWKVTGGSMKGEEYQAGGTPGTYKIEVAIPNGVSASATVIVKGKLGEIVNIKITPSSVQMKPFETERFFATGYNSAGQVVSFQPKWEATGGTITEDGMYRAESIPGKYFVRAIAPNGVSGITDVKIKAVDIAKVVVLPDRALLSPGQTQKFEVHAYDASNSEIPVAASWEATGGIIQSDGVYRAGSAPGTYLVKVTVGKISHDLLIVITGGEDLKKRIVITPEEVRLEPGQKITFKADVYDGAGRKIEEAIILWEATGGSIANSGEYQAGREVGTYFVQASTQDKTCCAAEVIIARAPATEAERLIIKEPRTVKLKPGQQHQFKASATAQGVEVPIVIIWEAQGGAITADGLYTAGSEEGKYLVTAATSTGLKARGPATVIIEREPAPSPETQPESPAQPAGRLQVAPSDFEIKCGEKRHISAVLLDPAGNSLKGEFSYRAEGGTVDAEGNYTAGDKPGTYEIVVTETRTKQSQKVIAYVRTRPRETEPLKIEVWEIGGGTEELGRIRIKGTIYAENAYLLQLVLFEKDGSRKVLSQGSVSYGQSFECKGAYVREVTDEIALILYDRKLNQIHKFSEKVQK